MYVQCVGWNISILLGVMLSPSAPFSLLKNLLFEPSQVFFSALLARFVGAGRGRGARHMLCSPRGCRDRELAESTGTLGLRGKVLVVGGLQGQLL